TSCRRSACRHGRRAPRASGESRRRSRWPARRPRVAGCAAMSERVTRRLRIHGRVQGVWYRESLREEADALGVTGWVRHCMDGTVEAVVQGDLRAVEALQAWARRGPRDARVDRVDVEDDAGGENFARFEKRPTGD